MTPQVSAFRWVPPFAQGFVRDLRVRWALEEAGFAYEAALIDFQTAQTPDYRAWQPFGQVPAFRDGQVEIFESGAIVLHIAAQSEALAPPDAAGRARVTAWVIAALNSVEPFARNFIDVDSAPEGAAWAAERRAPVEQILHARLGGLAAWLDGRDYLEGRFTAGDIVMATVLRELVDHRILSEHPVVDAYRRRCQARPAFDRALQAQLDVFRRNEPT